MKLAKQVKEVRKLKGYTQEKLAEVSGLSTDTISKIESGMNTNPTIYVVKALSRALDNIRFDIYEDTQIKKQ